MILRSLLVAALAAVSLSAQVLDATIAVSDNQPGNSDRVFGLMRDSSGTKLYAALCGDLAPWTLPPAQWGAYNNDNVVRIDVATGLQDALGTCGLFPEDIALTRNADGSTRHVWVTNSTSGTVTRLNPDLTGPVDISMTPCWGANYASVYSFGIIASADSTRVYAQGTSCGVLDVIDADPASATFSTILSSISVPDMFGRPAWINAQLLAIPYTTYNYNAALGYADSSITGIRVVDVVAGVVAATIPSGPAMQWAYPSITDLTVTASGKVLAAIGYGFMPTLVEFDPAAGIISRTLNFDPVQVGLGLHGITLSPDGSTCVITDMLGAQLVFVDVVGLTVAGTASVGTGAQPNELVYSRDGSRLYVSLQGSASIQRWRQLPGHDLRLSAPANPATGTTASFAVANIEAGGTAGLFVSLTAGPTTVGSLTLGLGHPFELFALLPGNADGGASLNVVVPSGLTGLSFWFQAACVDSDGNLRLSNTASSTIL